MPLEWVRQLSDEEIMEALDKDTLLIAESCGIDALLVLWDQLPSISLYISVKPLTELKKKYIRKCYDGSNVKKLAVTIECGERFIFEELNRKVKPVVGS